MQAIIRMVKGISFLKTCLFIVLTTLSFSVFAHGYVYVGNPMRPDTIWVPADCGCWHGGYYIKYIDRPTCRDIYWNGDHWQPKAYRVVGSY